MKMFRKRFIPDEIVDISSDEVLERNENIIITKWTPIKPRGDISGGISYTFLKRGHYAIRKKAELPNDDYKNNDGENVQDFTDLRDNSNWGSGGEPGEYFVFVSGDSQGVIAYYDLDGNITLWERSEEA